MHWPGIKPRFPLWEAKILPLIHQCCPRKAICNNCLVGVLFMSFSTAGHSCPLFPGRSRLSSSALRSTSCPLPPEGCFGRQSGVLWLHLSGGTACCSCSLAQPCPTLFDPLDSSPPGPSVHGFLAPLLETHQGSAAAPLPLAWLPVPCREHEVFCQDTGVKSPSLCLEAERTRWEMLQREGRILKSFPELLCGCSRLVGCPMTIMLSLVFWP